MTDFEFECMERKRLARQAQYRKRGSKSKKCPMSTDHMTYKQWKERCGAVVTVNIGKPISWDSFKGLSKQTQEEYVKDLMNTYGANATSLATMFNIQPLAVRRYIATRGLDITFQVGRSMNSEQRESWDKFLQGGLGSDASEDQEQAPPTTAKDIPHGPMSMNRFSISFNGKIDVNMIANSLLQILGSDAFGCIEITCNLNGSNDGFDLC